MHPRLLAALGTDGVLHTGRGRLGDLASQACRAGELVRLLPGAYARADGWRARCSALATVDPDAVVAGRAAAALHWWRDLPVTTVDAYRIAGRQPGYRWIRSSVPPSLVAIKQKVRYTSPALTVLDLIPELGAEVVDHALRSRAVTIEQLGEALALTPGRRGNAERRWLLDDSRDAPWSPLERRFHRRLRALELPWRYGTNVGVLLEDLTLARLDVAFTELLLGLEVDGYQYHSTPRAFQHDRTRDQKLAEIGWQVVRLTNADVDDPEVTGRIRQMLASRADQLGIAHPIAVPTSSPRLRAEAAAEREASYLSNRESRRSARSLPPVWQPGQ